MSLETPPLINRKTLLISSGLFALIGAITGITHLMGIETPFLILVIVLLVVGVSLQLESYYRTQDVIYQQDEKILDLLRQGTYQRSQDYRQIESLFSIFSLLKLNHPLPPMREWAISPDFAAKIIALIYERKPQLIVEASSGVSTLVSAYCLKQIGRGNVLALEHEAQYAQLSNGNVHRHGLQEIAQVIHAPLTSVSIGDRTWLWYDFEKIRHLLQPIDFLIIDGPPGDLQPLSRYPVLPLLWDVLSQDAIVLLDDGDRPDEQAVVARWQQEFPGIEVEHIANEKGAFLLRIRKLT
jgi:predicted O-methyltransferase YrrM